MRRIIIKREKCKLFAIWADYWCVLDFGADKIPPQCTKERGCIDCDEYCERLVSNKQRHCEKKRASRFSAQHKQRNRCAVVEMIVLSK